jgi:hypothetical protein
MRSFARRRQIVVDAAFALGSLIALALVGMIAMAELSTSFAGVAISGLFLLPAAVIALRPGAFDIASLGLTGLVIVGLPPLAVAITMMVLLVHPFGTNHRARSPVLVVNPASSTSLGIVR